MSIVKHITSVSLLLMTLNINSATTISKSRIEEAEDSLHKRLRVKRDTTSFVPDVNEIVTNTTFVEDVPNYPKDLVKAILDKEGDKFKIFFSTDPDITANEKTKRSINDPDISSCEVLTKIVYPKAALSKDNHWKYVIQKDEGPQGIEIQYCGISKTCSLGNDVGTKNATSECVQSYKYVQLLCMDQNKEVYDEFKLPSGCKCVMRRT